MINLDFKFKRKNFELNLTLNLNDRITGVFGPSGCGKTTLLEIISGLIKPDSGKIILGDRILFDSEENIFIPSHKRKIGLVFQEILLFPHLNVRKNLLYGYNQLKEKERKFKFDEIVALLEIKELLDRFPNTLSGGEKQRVAIGRTILSSPELLLLDEPLSSLDVNLKNQILPFLKKVFYKTKIPIIIVSHSINEILYLTDEIIALKNGKLLSHGKFSNIIRNMDANKMMVSSGFDNNINCIVKENNIKNGITTVSFNDIELKIPVTDRDRGSEIIVTMRSEDIVIGLEKSDKLSFQNQIRCRIKDIIIGEKFGIIILDMGSEIFAELTIPSIKRLNLKKDMEVYAFIKTYSVSEVQRCTCNL